MAGIRRFENLVNGARCKSQTGEWIASSDPYSGEVWAEVPQCDASDVDYAVEAAHRAFTTGPWAEMNPTQRGKLLRRLGDLISRDAEKLAELEVRDNGKLRAEMEGQLRYIPEWFHYFGGLADKIEGGVLDLSPIFPPFRSRGRSGFGPFGPGAQWGGEWSPHGAQAIRPIAWQTR